MTNDRLAVPETAGRMAAAARAFLAGLDETRRGRGAGPHVSLNFPIVGGRWISPTPCLLGAEPASYGLLAPLADDEELGFRFVNSLNAEQRQAAIIHHRPPPGLAPR